MVKLGEHGKKLRKKSTIIFFKYQNIECNFRQEIRICILKNCEFWSNCEIDPKWQKLGQNGKIGPTW